MSEKLFISTNHPNFLYKTKLNEKQKVGGQNHIKNNDAFEKPCHELQQDTSIAYPPASSGSKPNAQCSLYHTVHGHTCLEDSF